jgi:hypothetical protein
MAHIIGKQPNGLYCVYTTIADEISMYDCTEEELVQNALKEKEKEIREILAAQISTPRSEKKYQKIINYLEIHHSKEEADNWHKVFSQKEVK